MQEQCISKAEMQESIPGQAKAWVNSREELRHKTGQIGKGQMIGISNAEPRRVNLGLGDEKLLKSEQ